MKKIIVISFVILLINSCAVHYERVFLDKYESEDFSQFNNVHIFIRSSNRERKVIMVNAPHLINDTTNVGLYIVAFDRKNDQIIETKWTLTKGYVNADTAKLQQLTQAFIKYEIPRLNVDERGNVFVYLKDVETLTLARFVDESELLKYPHKWINVKNNWYKW